MFTGLIEATGRIDAIDRTPTGIRIRVETPLPNELTAGDSLSVNGVCLTVVDPTNGAVHADVSPETARVTTLGGLKEGTVVNLERSMRADARVGGHFVQGHVDATGTLETVQPEGDSFRLTFGLPPGLGAYVVHKGSIAVDGISLTVASIDDGGRRIDVQIIPFTWQHTNLRNLAIGAAVNIECDILGKYVVRSLELRNVQS
jgi:riboflavin synthase